MDESSSPTRDVYLALGSNIRPERFIPLVIEELEKRFVVKARSSVWETPAEGFSGADFLNAVVQIETELTPISLKFRVLRPLEAQLGRVRTEHKFSPRTIDIDPLVFGDEIMDQGIWTQAHLAVPLAELFPDLKHPDSGKSLGEISDQLLETVQITPKPGVHPDFSD